MALSLSEIELHDIPAATWQLLQAGVKSATDPLHSMCLATFSDTGPMQRTVVLRHVDLQNRTLVFNTDARSAKVDEIARDSRASWLFYDMNRKLQLRFSGIVTLHADDQLADERWSAMTANSRACYNSGFAPGRQVTAPPAAPAGPASEPEQADARKNFVAVACRAEFMDWLFLTHAGHRRAQFDWSRGSLDATWVAP